MSSTPTHWSSTVDDGVGGRSPGASRYNSLRSIPAGTLSGSSSAGNNSSVNLSEIRDTPKYPPPTLNAMARRTSSSSGNPTNNTNNTLSPKPSSNLSITHISSVRSVEFNDNLPILRGTERRPSILERPLTSSSAYDLVNNTSGSGSGSGTETSTSGNRLHRSSLRDIDAKALRISRIGSVAEITALLDRSLSINRGRLARKRWRVAITVVMAARFFYMGRQRSMTFDLHGANRALQREKILASRGGEPRDVQAPDSVSCLPSFSAVRGGKGKGPSAVTPYLYIGDRNDADNLPLLMHLRITHILNMATNLPPPDHATAFVYLLLPISDTEQQSIGAVLPHALALIGDAHKSGGRVLVHCMQGVSRSVTLAAAYLVSRDGPRWPLNKTMRRIRAVRPQAKPNVTFCMQLAHLEMDQQGVSSIADLDHADEMWDQPVWRNSLARKQVLSDSVKAYRSGATAKKIFTEWVIWIKLCIGFGSTSSARVAPSTEKF